MPLVKVVLRMKTLRTSILLVLTVTAVTSWTRAANIAWVSDVTDPFVGFSPPGSPNVVPYSDQAFVNMLINAGHNVIRYNGPNAQATLLSQEHIDALNTNDVIIIARVANSGAWRADQVIQWNTAITKPLICMSPYLTRTLAGAENRMGWFTAGTLPDSTPTVVWAADPTNPVTDYILGGVAMLGTNTVYKFDEPLDRNTSFPSDPPVPGGRVLVGVTCPRESDGVVVTGAIISEFPAGTAVRSGADILAGYRMSFNGGSRESGTAPANNVNLYAGRETLSPTGEDIFLRAVNVAINNGSAPPVDPNSPIVFTSQPASTTVLQSSPVTFSVAVSGAAPRTLQWQRDTGDGVTFTNIPDAATTFSGSAISLTNVSLADNNARFRVEATNPQGTVHSSVATLTVSPDVAPPAALSAATLDGLNIAICFNEVVDEFSAEDQFKYLVDDTSVPETVTLRPDGRSVVLTMTQPVGSTFVVKVESVRDPADNPMGTAILTGINHALTSVAVGALNPLGSSFSCASNILEVTGGGLDLQNATDQFQFLHRTVNGDFDAQVRVTSLVSSNAAQSIESTAKALLTARASTDANSAAVNVYVTPPFPADNSVLATFRATAGGGTTTNGAAFVPGGPPNGWIRLKRVGDVFTTYRSTNGSTWVQLGTTTTSLGPSALVGVGALSRRNGRLVTATFSDFKITQAPAAPVLLSPSYTGASFGASFQSQAGVTYEAQYNDNLNTLNWITFDTIIGDGTTKNINDPSPSPTKRFYRIRGQ
jgi:hypothetical protein